MSSHFEQQLKQRPIRTIPPDWQTDILRNARAVSSKPANAACPAWPALWRAIFQRVPAAWGPLAALWIMIFWVNSLIFSSNGDGAESPPVMSAAEERFSLRHLQMSELRLPSPDEVPTHLTPARPPSAPNGPRSAARIHPFAATSTQPSILEMTS